jgi:hypothetical protein
LIKANKKGKSANIDKGGTGYRKQHFLCCADLNRIDVDGLRRQEIALNRKKEEYQNSFHFVIPGWKCLFHFFDKESKRATV